MVILYVLAACYLLRVIPNSLKPLLLGIWALCLSALIFMINGVITIHSLSVIRVMAIVSISGFGVIAYACREARIYHERRKHLLHRWKNEITLKNAA